MNSSEGHLSKKDIRSWMEVFFPVERLNRVREGRSRSRRFVWSQSNERLVSFGIRPPKTFGSFVSDSLVLWLWISRCFNSGADAENFLNKGSK